LENRKKKKGGEEEMAGFIYKCQGCGLELTLDPLGLPEWCPRCNALASFEREPEEEIIL